MGMISCAGDKNMTQLAASRTSRLSQWAIRMRSARSWGLVTGLVLLVLLVLPVLAEAATTPLLEFRGQITLPPGTLARRVRISVALVGVEVTFTSQKRADSRGRFKFSKLQPGTYSLAILIPSYGEIRQTVEVTRSFSGPKGRVEKEFVFDEEALQVRAVPVFKDTVSVRELSISRKARGEYRKARKRLERRDADGAIEHLEKAVEQAPQFVAALNNLGTIYFQKKDFSRAERYFREALDQEPGAYQPMINLGGALLAQGRSREALEINLHTQGERPRDPLANAQLGFSYFMLADYDRALTYLELAKELDPGHFSNPRISLAEIHLRRSEFKKARRELEEFLEYHPDAPQAEKVRSTIQKIEQAQRKTPEQQPSL